VVVGLDLDVFGKLALEKKEKVQRLKKKEEDLAAKQAE